MMYYPLCCIQGYHVLLARHTTRDIIITEPQESEHLAASKYQNVLDIYIYMFAFSNHSEITIALVIL